MTHQWNRGVVTNLNFGPNHFAVVALNAGETILRIHFGLTLDGFFTNAPSTQGDIRVVMQNPVAFGWNTTIGDGTEAVPSPILSPGDASPPSERWLYLAADTPKIQDFSGASSTWPLSFHEDFANVQTKAQVKAPNMPVGSTLNLNISIDADSATWNPQTPTDEAWINVWWSVLVNRLP